jgi:hypothetical protein
MTKEDLAFLILRHKGGHDPKPLMKHSKQLLLEMAIAAVKALSKRYAKGTLTGSIGVPYYFVMDKRTGEFIFTFPFTDFFGATLADVAQRFTDNSKCFNFKRSQE